MVRARWIAMLLAWVVPAAMAEGLEGTWRGSLDGGTVVLMLEVDGHGQINGEPMRWLAQDGSLLIEVDSELLSYRATQRGDRLTLSGGDLNAPLRLRRGEAATEGLAPSRPAAAPSAPVPSKSAPTAAP